MPAADITSVDISFENGVKREEYGPVRKASVRLTAAVDKGEDGVVAMNYLATLVRAKVADMLGLDMPADARQAIEPGLDGGEAPAPPRQRRSRAQTAPATAAPTAPIAGDASASGAQTASGPSSPATPEDWEPEVPPTSSGSSGSSDEWEAAAPAPPISDADMAMHCSKHAQRLGGGEKVKAEISAFKPQGWDKPKFGVTDIPQAQRPAFVKALEGLS